MPYPEHWYGLSVAGSVTRTVLDTALWLDAVAGPAAGDANRAEPPARPFAESARTPPGRRRIAVSTKSPIPLVKVEEAAKRAARETAEVLRSLGHDVVERDPRYPDVRTSFIPRWMRGVADDAAGMPHPERLERRTRSLAALGRRIGDGGVRRARAREARMAAKLGAIFDDFDVLLTPAVPHPPREIGRYDARGWLWTMMGASNTVPFMVPWNVSGQPAMSVPAPTPHDGLPMGVELVGRPHDESTLISLAAQLEAEVGWPDRRPPVD
jgi:amidase